MLRKFIFFGCIPYGVKIHPGDKFISIIFYLNPLVSLLEQRQKQYIYLEFFSNYYL